MTDLHGPRGASSALPRQTWSGSCSWCQLVLLTFFLGLAKTVLPKRKIYFFVKMTNSLGIITRPGIAICLKLAYSENIRVLPRVIRLDPESDTGICLQNDI